MTWLLRKGRLLRLRLDDLAPRPLDARDVGDATLLGMEPFKNLLAPHVAAGLAKHLVRAGKDRNVRIDAGELARATIGLEDVEMKARAERIADALERVLPETFDEAAGILEATLAPQATTDDLASLRTTGSGVAGWIVWPLTLYVARRGGSNPKRALAALREMTMRFSSEFAIRTFVAEHPKLTFQTLARWTRDPNAHVRRLVSEGSRPRLPWGKRLDALVTDPSPTLPLLEALRDDPSEYVRRSVANHLNDIAKDHPDRFAEILEAWLVDASPERRRLLSHASRTLVKAGNPRVLRAFGLHRELEGTVTFRTSPKRVMFGKSLTLTLELASSSKEPQKLVIDYVVHHVRQNGSLSPKVFKGWTLTLGPGERRSIERVHAFRPITTRRYYSGRHSVECRINGCPAGSTEFELQVPSDSKGESL